MSTTNLFVELVVIGVGVFIWVVLFVFSVIGMDWIRISDTLLISSAIPALAFIYVLGIVWDRFIDYLFDRFWGESLRQEHFENRGQYYGARRSILINSAALSDLLEYGRSRMRICRGWSVNALMIGLSFNLYLWRQHGEHTATTGISLLGSIGCIILAIGCWYAWRNLTKVEYRKIRDQAKYLSENAEGDAW